MPIEFPATRWSLIARLPDQPQDAAVVLGLYADAVGTYLERKLAGERRERIEDIVQEVLLELMQKPELLARARPGEGSRFRHYLMELAWSAARNAVRRHRRAAGARELDADGAAAPGSPPEMDAAWAASVVRQALEETRRRADPEGWRVLELNLIGGRPLREAAAAAGLPLATCSRRLAAVRRQLQEAIADRLRLAGELAADEDGALACERLLESLRSQ